MNLTRLHSAYLALQQAGDDHALVTIHLASAEMANRVAEIIEKTARLASHRPSTP